MGRVLVEAAGSDPEDHRVRDALHAARIAETMVDVLVDLRRKFGLSQAAVAREMRVSRLADR